jgi:TPP-dependent pyruvate/acetoin dehydrogenase alpha subunit
MNRQTKLKKPILEGSKARVGREQKDLIIKLLAGLWRIRMVEERIASLYLEQQMRCPVHLSIGQEGVAVGVCSALRVEDKVLSGHRAHAHYLAKGGNLPRMLAEIYGRATGCAKGRGGSMHLIDLSVHFMGSTPVVGSTLPVAVGTAWAAKMKGEKAVAAVFMGEGAAEEGVWHECLNFASLHALPIIFVCENNLYSVYTHLRERQPNRLLTNIAAAHGLATYRGDGNDVLEVYRYAHEAVTAARGGNGPVFMEFATYRWREHCGPNFDNDLGYRTPEEFEEWQKKDPLLRVKRYVKNRGLLDDGELQEIRARLAMEIDEAVAFAQASPWPQAQAMTVAGVYADSKY